MTPKEIIRICKKLDMTRAEISRQIGVSSKALYNWQHGLYPMNAKAEKKLLRLLKKTEESAVTEDAETEVEAAPENNWPIYLQAQGIKRLFEKHGESYAAFGRRLGTSGLTVRHWITDQFIPSDKFREPLKLLWEETFNRTPGTMSVRGKSTALVRQTLAAEPLLELSTEFYNEYRNIRNQQDVNAVIAFASAKAGVNADALRQALAFVLLTLKKEMDTETIYRCLTGHV